MCINYVTESLYSNYVYLYSPCYLYISIPFICTMETAKVLEILLKKVTKLEKILSRYEFQEPEFMTEQEVIKLTGKSKRVLADLRKRGILSYTSINGRTPRYESRNVYKLIQENSN